MTQNFSNVHGSSSIDNNLRNYEVNVRTWNLCPGAADREHFPGRMKSLQQIDEELALIVSGDKG
jgi:hypothetical protein